MKELALPFVVVLAGGVMLAAIGADASMVVDALCAAGAAAVDVAAADFTPGITIFCPILMRSMLSPGLAFSMAERRTL